MKKLVKNLANSYDQHGNVQTLLREIKGLVPLLNDYKLIDYSYDLVSGKVNEVAYQNGKADQYLHRYSYNADNRLISVETGPGKYQLDEDARYRYYLHGPLARMELGRQKVQGLDYAYTIQGWLKAVNSGHLTPQRDLGRDAYQSGPGFTGNGQFPADAFGFNLSYFEGDYKPSGTLAQNESFVVATESSAVGNQSPNLFNGNIRMMTVAIRQFGVYPLVNSYRYDQLYRIISSTSFIQYDSPPSKSLRATEFHFTKSKSFTTSLQGI